MDSRRKKFILTLFGLSSDSSDAEDDPPAPIPRSPPPPPPPPPPAAADIQVARPAARKLLLPEMCPPELFILENERYFCGLCRNAGIQVRVAGYPDFRAFSRHLKAKHLAVYDDCFIYKMTSVDHLLKVDWLRFGLPLPKPEELELQFRGVYVLQWNSKRLYADIILAHITKDCQQKMDVTVKALNPTKDYFLPLAEQLNYHTLRMTQGQKGTAYIEVGHILGRNFLPKDPQEFKKVDKFSIVAWQWAKMNTGDWATVEAAAVKLTNKYDVWLINGVVGQQTLQESGCKELPTAAIPTHWWSIILVCDSEGKYLYDCYVFPNRDYTESIASCRKNLDELATFTTHRFLSTLPNLAQEDLVQLSSHC